MGSDDFTWIAQAIAIHREVGGNLAEVLDAVGHTIRERNAIRRQVKALSAEGKLSAIVLMALPFASSRLHPGHQPAYLAKFTQSMIGYGMIASRWSCCSSAGSGSRRPWRSSSDDDTIPIPCWRAAMRRRLACPAARLGSVQPPGRATAQARANLLRGIEPVRRPDGRGAVPGSCGCLARRLTPAAPSPGSTGWPAAPAARPEWPVPKLVAAKLVLAVLAGPRPAGHQRAGRPR